MKTLRTKIVTEFRDLDTSDKKLRSFGFFVGGTVLVVISALALLTQVRAHDMFALVAFVLVALAFISPRLLLFPYYVWMGIAIVLGAVLSPIILAILFFGVLTPIATLKRLMASRERTGGATYWRPHEGSQDPKQMEELQ